MFDTCSTACFFKLSDTTSSSYVLSLPLLRFLFLTAPPFLPSVFKKIFSRNATSSKFCNFSSATLVLSIAVYVFNVASHLFLDARRFNRSASFLAFEMDV